MSFFTNIYGILFRPAATIKYMVADYNLNLLLQAILTFIVASVISSNLSTAELVDSVMTWFFIASIVFLVGYVFKITGQEYPKLLTVLAYANLPLIFIAPVRIFTEIRPILGSFLSLVIMLWSLKLSVTGIAEVCEISRRKAVLLIAVPFIAFVFLFFGSIFQLLLIL